MEEEMNRMLHRLGLTGWKALWDPDFTAPNRGQSYPETRIIIIHDEEPDAARETLVHEALEVKMRSVVMPYREVLNALIEAFDKVVYQQKESFLDELTPFMLKAVQDEKTS